MRARALLCLSLLAGLFPASGHAAAPKPAVTVADPYLEMHTGPGVGYPIFHVVERGESITILKRRTEWFKVRTQHDREGWVEQAQLERTLQPSGEAVGFAAFGFGDYSTRRWEMGVLGGDFGGANVIALYGARQLTPNLSLEIGTSQVLGSFSDGWLAGVNVVHSFFPEWRASPFFTLGTGMMNIEPKATVVRTEDRSDQYALVGTGVRAWVTRQFLLRAEYKSYVVLTSRDDNEEVNEWTVGFSFFF
jgi:Bacterial SH3 domain